MFVHLLLILQVIVRMQDVVVDVDVVAAHAPSPKDTPAMAISMIKSSFGFVMVVFLIPLLIMLAI
jgi:hypothetical protein